MLTQTLLAVLAPLAAWLVISGATFVRRSSPGEGVHRFAAGVALSAGTLSWLLSLGLLRAALGGEMVTGAWPWLSVGPVTFTATLGVDRLTAVMLAVVSTVSLLVQVYSLGYMHGDSHFPRYYAVVSLFTFAMLLLVVARDYLLLLLAWELMGVCSHLLIGHYFTTETAQKASVKAFLTTRLGDVGLFLALMVLFAATGTLTFAGVEARLPGLAPATVTWAALGLFAAAAGKSAQAPLHVWLPDAMAGPTPASALIHAATMVAAGVYLVARSFPLFAASHAALAVVAYVGAITAFLAATMALATHDLKRVLAYSTISQLGYMMLALGSLGREAALFHLVTHAFFKAMLFLAAGTVIHAVHTQDLRELGGLWRVLPVTSFTFLVGALALVGIPPFSGYFSKEQILAQVAAGPFPGLLYPALFTVGLTGLYTTRAYVLAFLGRPRGEGHLHHRPSTVMTAPLVALSLVTLAGGWVGEAWLTHGHGAAHSGTAGVSAGAAAGLHWVAPAALTLALLGVALGWLLYGTRVGARLRGHSVAGRLLGPASRGYQIDTLWERLVLENGLRLSRLIEAVDRCEFCERAAVGVALIFSRLAESIDRRVIDPLVERVAVAVDRLAQGVARCDQACVDGAVNALGSAVTGSGQRLGRLETGYLANYLLTFLLGLVTYLVAARL